MRFEDKILRKFANEDKPQVVEAFHQAYIIHIDVQIFLFSILVTMHLVHVLPKFDPGGTVQTAKVSIDELSLLQMYFMLVRTQLSLLNNRSFFFLLLDLGLAHTHSL